MRTPVKDCDPDVKEVPSKFNPKAHKQLEDRMKRQFPPIDMNRPACNTHDCPVKERDESEW